MKYEKIITPVSEKYLDENGILHSKVHEGVEITLEKVVEDLQANRKLAAGKKIRILYDARPRFMITLDARLRLLEDVFNEQIIATAVVSNRHGVRAMVKFMQDKDKTLSPMRVFSDEEKALEWLNSFAME
jgi:hypothetical protein